MPATAVIGTGVLSLHVGKRLKFHEKSIRSFSLGRILGQFIHVLHASQDTCQQGKLLHGEKDCVN